MSQAARSDPRKLVQATAARLRELILAAEPDACIGSLTELARGCGVGVVTVQQAARILEHEGLLQVRRGPGGGYYGKRPTEASLERSIAAYLQVNAAGFRELFEMMSLLEAELAPAAARSQDPALRERLQDVLNQLERSETIEAQLAVEAALHEVLFRMAERPLMGLIGRVTMSVYQANPAPSMFLDREGNAAWREGRRRIVAAILAGDPELAGFQTRRYRADLLQRLTALHGQMAEGPSPR